MCVSWNKKCNFSENFAYVERTPSNLENFRGHSID